MTYNFTAEGNQLVSTDLQERVITFLAPTFEYDPTVKDPKLVINDFGRSKQELRFAEFGTIAGEVPTDLEDAVNKLKSIVANFNSGGDTPELGYKEFVARLFQSGTSDPTIQILKNTTGAVISASRLGLGEYQLTADTPVFTMENTVPSYNDFKIDSISVFNYDGNASGRYFFKLLDASSIRIRCFDETESATDDFLNGNQIIDIKIFD